MGVTVSTAKLAAAYQANNGQTVYVLFEQTFDKNDYPHTPTWCCIHIGGLQSTLHRIFKAAGVCVGGLLDVRGGRNQPQQYIADWLKELASPVHMPNQPVTLKVDGSLYATIPQDKASKAGEAITRCGHSDIAQTLASGGAYETTLYSEPQLLEALYGQFLIGPWRLIRATPLFNERCPDLGYRPEPVTGFMPRLPAVLKLDQYNRLVQGQDGMWRCEGWEYSVIGDYVESLWEVELKEPGVYAQRISAFTEHVKAAAAIPPGTHAVVDRTVPLSEDWQILSRDQVLRSLGLDVLSSSRCFKIPVTFNHEHINTLMRLSKKCLTWHLGQPPQQQLEMVA